MLYNWGYSNYYNPYYGGYGVSPSTTVVQQPVVYDYAQPINSLSASPDEAVVNQADSAFDQARQAFAREDYAGALRLADQAVSQMPNDPTLHEFRALTLFAMGRYDEAAAVLYTVLSVGPGWDWTTLIGLYGNPDVYTQQLRALENYCNEHRQSAAGHFVLAYQYLTEGHADAAVSQLKTVVALQPKDQLAAQLLQQLEQPKSTTGEVNIAKNQAIPSPPGAISPAGATTSPGTVTTGKEGRLEGTWTAHPNQDTTITVTFKDPQHFDWKVVHQGQEHEIQGEMNYGNGVLTLSQNQNNAMAGNVQWQADNQFNFKVVGGGPSDPGLTFTKTS
jgi:tetratricopeptide (TPR) repeat protein